MARRSALKISFSVIAGGTVVLAMFVMVSMLRHMREPLGPNARLKLIIVSSADPGPRQASPMVRRAPAVRPGAGGEPEADGATPGGNASLDSAIPPAAAPPTGRTPPMAYAPPGASPSAPGGTLEPGAPLAPPSSQLPDPNALASTDMPAPDKPPLTGAPSEDVSGVLPPPATGLKRSVFKATSAEKVPPGQPGESLRILQIGDSHTAADMFSGIVRAKLQAIYGDGGAGYLVVGKPNPGVRSDILRMSTSPGWTYTAIQKTEDASQFHLSGFNAFAARSGETLTLSTGKPISFDSIDIQLMHGPRQGSVELRFDNDQAVRFDLAGDRPEWWFLRATPQRKQVEQLKQLSITTLDSRPVDISSVAIFNQTYGVSYSAIGFPGATIDIVNKFSPEFFGDDLARIDPQIVVLAFGTNEGFNDTLDIAHYGERYQLAVAKVQAALPNAEIVLVGPPFSNRLPRGCHAEASACHRGSYEAAERAHVCAWLTPPKLDRVREMIKLIATQKHLHYWNWSEVMPQDCGPQKWVTASPRLMQPDHVHFTGDGYRTGAGKFADYLLPIIEKLRLTDRVVSNN